MYYISYKCIYLVLIIFQILCKLLSLYIHIINQISLNFKVYHLQTDIKIKRIDPRNIGKLYPTYDVKIPTKGFINNWTIALDDNKTPIVSFSLSNVCNFILINELNNTFQMCMEYYKYKIKFKPYYLGRSGWSLLVALVTKCVVLVIHCMYKCSGIIGTVIYYTWIQYN